MALDIAGMLTGVSNQPVNPNLSVQQQQLAMGANATRMMQGGMESLRRSAGGSVPMAEQLQMAMGSLDPSKTEDAEKLIKLMMATGNIAGATKLASQIKATQLEEKKNGDIVRRLEEAGLNDEASAVANKLMSTDQGMSILNNRASQLRTRALNKEDAEAQAETNKQVDIQQQLILARERGVSADNPIVDRIRSKEFTGFTLTEMNKIFDINKLRTEGGTVKQTNIGQYLIPNADGTDKQVWAGLTTIGDNPPQMMYATTDDAGVILGYTPLATTAKKVGTGKTPTGVDFTTTDVTDAMELLSLSTRGPNDSKLENDTGWTDLDMEQKLELSNRVASETQRLIKEKGIDKVKAQRLAITSQFTDHITKAPDTWFGTSYVWTDPELPTPSEDNALNAQKPLEQKIPSTAKKMKDNVTGAEAWVWTDKQGVQQIVEIP